MNRNLRGWQKDPSWESLSKAKANEMNFVPNRVYQNFSLREVMVVSRRSELGGFSISKTIIDYYMPRLRSRQIHQVWVMLTEPDGTEICWTSLMEVVKSIGANQPNQSTRPGWADYYWIDEQFNWLPPSGPDELAEERML